MKNQKYKTYLSDRFFVLLALCQLLGVVSILFPFLLSFYFLTWPLLLIIVWKEYSSLPFCDFFSGYASIPRSPEMGERCILKIFFKSEHPQVLKVSNFFLRSPNLKTISFEKKFIHLTPNKKEGWIVYEGETEGIAQALGYEILEELILYAHSSLGFCFRSLLIPIQKSEMRVIPTRKKISEQTFRELIKNQSLFTQGNRKIVRGRNAEQFYSIREYQYPDSRRHIDAKKSAKFGQLMTRVYDSFYDHHLIMALDVGRSMCGEMGLSKKHDYYLSACLALADNAYQSRDRLSFFAFSQRIHYSIKAVRHLAPFQPLFRGHPSLYAREEESNFEVLFPTLQQITGQRSIVVVLTDISRPSIQVAALNALRPILNKHLTVIISLVDDEYSLDKKILSTNVNKLSLEQYNQILYSYWIQENFLVFQNKMARLGGGVLVVGEREWLSAIEKLYSLLRNSMRI